MELLAGNPADKLLSSLVTQQGKLEYISRQALSSGIDKFQKKDYQGAVKDFGRALGISPQSSFSVDASNYLANAYVKLGNNDKAIQVYKEAIGRRPAGDDIRIKLGNLFFSLERFGDAETEYRAAVKINKNATSLFSLGQAQLKLKNYKASEYTFREIIRLDPKSGNGNYGLGLVFQEQALYDEAITQLKVAVELKEDFFDGYVELGYIYADTGQTEEARKIVEFLEDKRSHLAGTLSSYIYQNRSPEFGFISLESTFPRFSSPATAVSSLDSYLENANASKQFTMVFQFTKQMDMVSVQNRANWRILRSEKSDPGAFYNFGKPVPETEINIAPIPDRVIYSTKDMQATVTFTITQNSAADATIDPSHILFKFGGEDIFGNTMDTDNDEYSSYSGIV